MLDPSYRRALKLDADRFAVSFDLSELGILAQVKRLMAPYAEDMKADLYKLNMCAPLAPSHHFASCFPTCKQIIMLHCYCSPAHQSATLSFYLKHLSEFQCCVFLACHVRRHQKGDFFRPHVDTPRSKDMVCNGPTFPLILLQLTTMRSRSHAL